MCPVFLNANPGKPGPLIPWPNFAVTSLCATPPLRCAAPCSSPTGTAPPGFPRAGSVTKAECKHFIWAAQKTVVGRGKWHRKRNPVLTGYLALDSWWNAAIKHIRIIPHEKRRNQALTYQLLHSVIGWELLLGLSFLSSFLAAFLRRQKNGVSQGGWEQGVSLRWRCRGVPRRTRKWTGSQDMGQAATDLLRTTLLPPLHGTLFYLLCGTQMSLREESCPTSSHPLMHLKFKCWRILVQTPLHS